MASKETRAKAAPKASKAKSTTTSTRSKKKRAAKKPSAAARRSSAKSSGAKRPATAVGRVASVLPGALRDAKYVKRTLEILDSRERKRERLDQQTKKQLVGVVKDIQTDVTDRIEAERDAVKRRVDDTVEKAKQTKVGQRIDEVEGRVTKAVDRWLARVGLQRKAA
ncbi:MAG: hypothetical protein RMA76_12045 [Deltaproteobacteria bacterium]|jgi:hypothetical protein